MVETKNLAGTIIIKPISDIYADKIVDYYIPIIGTMWNLNMHPTTAYLNRRTAKKLLIERTTKEETLDNRKEIRGEKPGYFKALIGLVSVVAASGLIYFMYKKVKKKKEINYGKHKDTDTRS